MSGKKFILAVLLTSACPCVAPALAQSVKFSDLEGHSIIAEYEEEVSSRRRGSFRSTWHDRVYVSTKGRIFHRFQRQSSRPEFDRASENITGEEGESDGRDAAYRWNGGGISREWTNPRGVRIRQSIVISPANSGFSCRVTIDRAFMRGVATMLRQSCRIVKGNVLAQ